MSRLSRAVSLSSELNVTPMLDVLLVLLVIFMASVQRRRTMDVSLPAPCTGSCRGGTPIVLEVLPHNEFRLNSAPLAARDLERRLHAVYSGRPDKVLQVAGSRTARYQDVMWAMDVARSAGVRVIGIPPGGLASPQ